MSPLTLVLLVLLILALWGGFGYRRILPEPYRVEPQPWVYVGAWSPFGLAALVLLVLLLLGRIHF